MNKERIIELVVTIFGVGVAILVFGTIFTILYHMISVLF
jgi:hypothetical protein